MSVYNKTIVAHHEQVKTLQYYSFSFLETSYLHIIQSIKKQDSGFKYNKTVNAPSTILNTRFITPSVANIPTLGEINLGIQ